jgi:TatD DNase family protein
MEGRTAPERVQDSLDTLEALIGENRVKAIGECGFDLYNEEFRRTEALQDAIFGRHLEIALERGLPLVLHVRRAMHKIFALSRELRRVPAVVFHSYSGTPHEGEALIKRGINAYFSFGTPVVLNHKTAMKAAAALPLDRLLLETDAPFQPLRGAPFSRWADLAVVTRGVAALRRDSGRDGAEERGLEAAVDRNFMNVFGLDRM